MQKKTKNNILSFLFGAAITLTVVVVGLGGIHLFFRNVDNYTKYIAEDGIEYLITTSGIKVDDPIFFFNYSEKNYKIAVYIENNTEKDIKYITIKSGCYNRVGDPAQVDFTLDNELETKYIGPIEKNQAYYFSTDGFDSSTMEYVMLEKIKIEYMDGTSETINNINMKHRDAYSSESNGIWLYTITKKYDAKWY